MPAKKSNTSMPPPRKKKEKKRDLYHWSDEDLSSLKKLYPTLANAEIAKKLKRTKSSVDKKAHELSLRKERTYRSTIAAQNNAQRKNSWRADEVAKLKKLFDKHTYAELTSIFGRNAQSIQSKATRLGLWKYKTDSRST